MVKEFFATYVKGIESVDAIGAVFEQIFLSLPKFASGCVDFICLQRFSILAGIVYVTKLNDSSSNLYSLFDY